jgi:Fe-S-cluster containining protein
VAEAAKKALGTENIEERIFIVKLVNDKNDPNRVAGAVGFSTREDTVHVYKFKACLLAAGGCVNIFRPRSVGEGTGRAWYPVWNVGSTYAMAAEAGAELTMMENRFVPTRFKDGYGPVGAWFLLFKAKATNAFNENYMVRNKEMLDDYPPYSHAAVPASCLRNHLMLKEMKKGRGPIYMDTVTTLANLRETLSPREVKHLETEAWEDFLDMCVGQCGIWVGENIEPEKKNSELMPIEPYLLGSHSGCCGIYENRPSACRYYPVGLLPLRRTGVNQDEHHYCIVQEDHCKGHDEDNQLTIGQYRKEQGVEEYDEMNREWYQIILKKRSAGPAIGKPPEMTFQLFFMASYDIDRFRRFVTSDSFKKTYTLEDATYKSFEDNDVALMKFGFQLMKQVFFGEMTIPTKDGAVEERIEKRKEVIELRRQAEIELHKMKNDNYENMEK